jgi:uncharacterized protein
VGRVWGTLETLSRDPYCCVESLSRIVREVDQRQDVNRGVRWERALVTGASVGIGAAFARELARRGCDLVLVARGSERLEMLANELQSAFGVAVESLAADLTAPETLAVVEARLEADEQPVNVLVNNAGRARRYAPFLELDRDTVVADAYLNALALLRLTHAAAGAMARRGGGTVINVSAGVAFYPLPGAAAYAACKAFVNSLSEALDYELRDTGVRVTAVCPGFTRTGAQERLGIDTTKVPSWLWMQPQQVASAALQATQRRATISSLSTIGGLSAFFGRHLPRRLLLPPLAKGQARILERRERLP